MTQKIKLITIIDLLFLMILGAAGSVENDILSDLVYYLAFLIPIALGISHIFGDFGKQSNSMSRKAKLDDFKLTREGAILSLPLIFPEILAVLLISVATSELMALLGQENTASFTEPFIYAVFIHALIPAILEELLFRFVPIKILKGEEKTAVILSSVMFAFAHANLFQIPYAFIAGLIFAFVYVATGSIFPSVIMHFMNNLVSLTSIYGFGGRWLVPTLATFSLISIIIILIRRRAYAEKIKALFKGNEIYISYLPLLFVAVSLTLAISTVFV